MEHRYIRTSELASAPGRPGRWPVSQATLWRWVASGHLPAPVRLGPQTSAWPLDVIVAFETKQAAVPAAPERKVAAGRAGAAARHAKRESEAA